MTDIKTAMSGTCLYIEDVGTAKKAGHGWVVRSQVGKVFPTVTKVVKSAYGMSNVRFVETKKAAREELKSLATMKDQEENA